MQLGVRQARYFGRRKTLFQLLMAATVANLTLVATKTERMGSNGGRSVSLSTLIAAFAKSIWGYLSHLEFRLAPVGLQEPAFRLDF